MTYKFLQISNIGFNHSLSSDIEINKYVEKSRRETFIKIIDYCIAEKITALLICGNLYDEAHISYDNAMLIKRGFAKLKAKDITIVYAHGNLDKGFFLDSIENDVIEIKSRYTKHIHSFPFDLDTINFVGIGHSKRLVFQDEFLEEEPTDIPTIGLMYIDNEIYKNQTKELLYRRMEKSNMTYWAVGGEEEYIAKKKGSNYCVSGYCCPKRGVGAGCVLVTISNKLKVSTKPVNVCTDVYKKIVVDDAYRSRDIYQLLERCADLIVKSKVPGHNMIVSLELSGPCGCYNQLANHKGELQDEIAKITETQLSININNLTKAVKTTKEIEEENKVTELLEECYQLYDDEELYNRTVNKLKSKRVFYNKDAKDIDKRKILEGVDSIIVESAIKEDSHDY